MGKGGCPPSNGGARGLLFKQSSPHHTCVYYNTRCIRVQQGVYLKGMNAISKKLGENLRRLRTEKGMTQDDICRVLNLDRGYISSIENGKRNPTLSTLAKIAGALKLSVDELLK